MPGDHLTLDDLVSQFRTFLGEQETDVEWGSISIKRRGRPLAVLVVDPPPSDPPLEQPLLLPHAPAPA